MAGFAGRAKPTVAGPAQRGSAGLVSIVSTQATRGLLDIGLAFFTTMAIVFAQLARRWPPWWLAVAAACWLGSLQKLPLPFFVCVIIVLVRLMSRDDRAGLRTGRNWLIASMILAIAAIVDLAAHSNHKI